MHWFRLILANGKISERKGKCKGLFEQVKKKKEFKSLRMNGLGVLLNAKLLQF
jgi:hypothetical protein